MPPRRSASCRWWVACCVTAPTVLSLSVLAACGGSRDLPVSDLALAFVSAVSDRDAVIACGLLAPSTRAELERSAGKPCERAVLAAGLPQDAGAGADPDVEVYGTAGRVRLAEDTVFVSLFPAGWKVTAAGCTRVPGRPYECLVKGS